MLPAEECDGMLTQFENVVRLRNKTVLTTTETIKPLLDKYANSTFCKIDHNERQAAILCPRRYHHELFDAFISDTRHFQRVLPNTTLEDGFVIGTDVEQSVQRYTKSKLDKKWLKRTWEGKDTGLSYLYLTVKTDGVRFRPIGSTAPLPHKRLLSICATALHTVLMHSGLKHHTFTDSFQLKNDIRQLDDLAQRNGWFVWRVLWDIKNFYTEINKHALLPRLKYVLDRYRAHNRTNKVSVPKIKTKNTKPKPGTDRSGKYFDISLDMLFAVIKFAMETAFFKLGMVILLQVLGLVMGDPLSPPLAQLFVSFDEHHQCALNIYANSNIVHRYQKRYMDDIICVLLTSSHNPYFVNLYTLFMMYRCFEHDLPTKFLELVQSKDGNKFLDADVLVSRGNTRIKIVYHNKNASILFTNEQEIGRFHEKHACSPIRVKINSIANILARAHRFTSFEWDLRECFQAISHEALLLDFTQDDLKNMLITARKILLKSDPCALLDDVIRGFR